MAGTGWKAVGVILIVLGSALSLVGVAAGVLGGATAADAAGDAERHDCGLLRNEACSPEAPQRAEAGAEVAAAGVGTLFLGLLVVVLGVVLLFVGVAVARARDERHRRPAW
jgi:uncharacterized membrane protein